MLQFLMLVFLWGLSSAFPSENRTYMQKCKYEGHQVVLLSDRLQVDGRDVLVLNKLNNTWTVFVADKQQDSLLKGVDTLAILKECQKLHKELRHMETSAGMSWFRLVVLVLAVLVFISMVLLSFMMSNRY
ncbi:hypothetical protein NFI96_015717, partial [Prochilodus magdalenae]